MADELPSGEPTDEQRHDVGKQVAFQNFLQAIAGGAGGMANVFKPGTSSPGANEQFFQGLKQQAEEPYAQAQQQRKHAMENTAFANQQEQTQREKEKFGLEKQQREMEQDKLRRQMDPNSAESKSAQQEAATMHRVRSEIIGESNPYLGGTYARMSTPQALAGKSAAQLAAEEPAHEKMTKLWLENEANKSKQSQAQAQLHETSQTHRDAAQARRDQLQIEREKMGAGAEAKVEAKMNKDKSIEKDIADLMNTKGELLRHAQNLRSGVVNNDKAHVYTNEAKKLASSLGAAVEPDAALQDMLTSVPLAQGSVEKAVTGSSRYTPQRWVQFAVQPGEGTKNSINKLEAGARFIDELMQERRSQLDVKPSGAPVSTSGMSQALPPGAIQKASQHSLERANGVKPIGERRIMKDGTVIEKKNGKWEVVDTP